MSIRTWLSRARVRRGLAASFIVLSAGGLVLLKTPAAGKPVSVVDSGGATYASTSTSSPFAGPNLSGRLALSQSAILANGERTFYATIDLDAAKQEASKERAPISMAIVLDTSGSMQGDKIEQAERAAIALLRDMRDDDEIAFIHYASTPELVQPLAKVGEVRSSLTDKIARLTAGGGTNIAPALQMGLNQLQEIGSGRVARVVLASDGLDSTRVASFELAKNGAARGVTISAMGIGLDYDSAYMGGVAENGRGNFAFVRDQESLSGFLKRELDESASTVVADARVKVTLPSGVRLARAVGAQALASDGGLDLGVGALFSGDHRRVVLELTGNLDADETRAIGASATWSDVKGARFDASAAPISIVATNDARRVDEGRDGEVFAEAMSVLASQRQLEAAAAYDRGDFRGASSLIQQNVAALDAAAGGAPKPMAAELAKQRASYSETGQKFAANAPSSDAGKVASKAAAAQNLGNLSRKGSF